MIGWRDSEKWRQFKTDWLSALRVKSCSGFGMGNPGRGTSAVGSRYQRTADSLCEIAIVLWTARLVRMCPINPVTKPNPTSHHYQVVTLKSKSRCAEWMRRHNAAGIETGYGLQRQRSRSSSPRGEYFSPLHVVQTGSGAHSAFYPMGTGGSFSGQMRQKREADHHL
jgi:hypothetical protein